MSEQRTIEQWAIVELFGHQRIAGRVSEQTIGGCSFVRVDVPELVGAEGKPPLQGFTKLYGQGAIYAVTFVDQPAAMAAARALCAQPIAPWELGRALQALPAGADSNDEIPY